MQATSAAWAALLCASLMIIVPAVPAASPVVPYLAGTTAVVKQQGQAPIVDDGVVLCKSSGPSIGGGCLKFSEFNSLRVQDDVQGTNVAFQVCIDNDGDRKCTSGQGAQCDDDIFFSHNDNGQFFNPLGPLPQGFRAGCANNGGWNGYVVFLCTGIHAVNFPGTAAPIPGSAHAHAATQGTLSGTAAGTGYGDFCRPHDTQVKTYILQ